ncbi:helix-turn-helix domain-containing protein [Microbacterium sp. P01]|uniref:helix-turn-helix domain-containing protein n=1 Tax=unclassified Microbacterium TaxID=2609290 RepID=UPI00367224FC
MADRTLGELLRAHRLAEDLTLEALAERATVSDRTISDIERGVSLGPRRSTVDALAAGLQLDPRARDELVTAARTGRRSAAASAPHLDRQPRRLRDFTGREKEITRLVAFFADAAADADLPATAVAVLSGAPGVGKTTIAVEAAHRVADGDRVRLFVDLGSSGGARLSPVQVLQALLRQVTHGADESRTLTEAKSAWSAATERFGVIAVLDDAASEAQVRPALNAAENAIVLVTSRRSLAGLEGARHFSVGTLARSESVRFLEETIPADQRRAGDLDELAALCGDLPLALRVAANRIASRPAWDVDDFLRRLRSERTRLRSLVAGDLGVAPAFAASYADLPPQTQDFFRTLSLLHGSSFTARLAGAASGIEEDAAYELLEELVDLGLVESLRGYRYRLHDLLRIYAAERLSADVPADVVARREQALRSWLLATAADAGLMFASARRGGEGAGPSRGSFETAEHARAWLMGEADAWFSAYRETAARGLHGELVEAAAGITPFGDRWHAWGHWHEFFELAASSAAAVGDGSAQADALNNLGHMHGHETFDFAAALEAGRRALAVAQECGDERQIAWAGVTIGFSAYHLDDMDLALSSSSEAISLFLSLADAEGELQARATVALVLMSRDPAAALAELERILDVTDAPTAALSEHYRHITRLNSWNARAKALLSLERYAEAADQGSALIRVAELSVPIDDAGRARGHRHRGFARLGQGDLKEARRELERALELAGEHRPEYWADEIQAALDSLPPGSDD